ncbi:hypothetical protein PBRA_002557 [Plasmodiophora brassicae]|uniref:Uncharacterized protein n=1 Tax=Plasmodiophora brassicae TaxID=37360 RepID=A0A0G4J4T8_PLABS|nr:hypothetical protein PBRA_002557 [Plasmodiophora brassicae]
MAFVRGKENKDVRRQISLLMDVPPPTTCEPSASLVDNIRALGIEINGDEDLLSLDDVRGRNAIQAVVSRVAHLNQVIQEVQHDNFKLKEASDADRDALSKLAVENEGLRESAFRWKQRVDLLDKERSAMEKKSKAAMSQLEKRLNAIKFKDRQYANEIRKRELECGKYQKRLRALMAADKSTIERSRISVPQSSSSAAERCRTSPEDNVNLRQSVKQLEQAVGELQAENARMREFILCVHKSIANSSFGKGVTPPVTEEQLALPFSFVSDNLQTWLTQCVARSNQESTPSNAVDREDGELVKAKETIKELSAIIAQQEQVIQRALFSTSEPSS